ncbi:hypothetical protein HETIRDRAFT_453598 [Heterobasidion irregulare TC 32-1]|uniref:Uncharacterized protein n=1 Tax=Heterobasidion irregulare (strain TC 32-1) TaxID=747525 RepID=W4K045_HETIT|nr:uncharacterized protein HETIRDRAFT_453598 [Heterobasidion irregulare TC 32-1]ETW79099.1 hypothetical protein HETIRDRAFT_453598 [Heterobasidion irregulare TC 32-1]
MEDVWGNAWSDTADSSRSSQTANSLWTTKPRSQLDDDEADIAMPSWATGTGINWDEPSEHPASLWSQGATSPGWSPANPYSSFAIGKSRSPEPSEPSRSSTARVSDESQSSPASPTSSAHDERPSSPSTIEEESQGVIPQPSSPMLSTPSTPDGFGGFETALAAKDTDAWSTPSESFKVDVDGANTWASAWAEPQTSTSTTGEQEAVDEWEAAKREKEAMDRRVPPELLANILQQVEEVSKEVWPEPENLEEDQEWQKRLHAGMDAVDGLDALMTRYCPDMTLPPLKPFTQSFTGKAMVNSIKLSRNILLTKSSPMSNFLAAKGSTAWELSVKSRVEVVEDEVPAGWRILEKDNEEKVEEKGRKSGSGLLASLWNRRASSTREALKVASPVQEITAKIDGTVPTARSSMDSIKSSTSVASKGASPIASSSSLAHSLPTAAAGSTTLATSGQTPPMSTPMTSYSDSGLPAFEPLTSPSSDSSQAPSAVSRFFNRFSRSRVPSTSSPRNSLALSTDDLEFLTDLVPSANDADDADGEKDPQLRGLASMLASKPIGGKLPAPLPPPPSASSVMRALPSKATGLGTTQHPGGDSTSIRVRSPSFHAKSLSPVASTSASTLPPPLAPTLAPLTPSSRSTSPALMPTSPHSHASRPSTHRTSRTNSHSSLSSVLSSPADAKPMPSALPTAPLTTSSRMLASGIIPPPPSVASSSLVSSRAQTPAFFPPPPPTNRPLPSSDVPALISPLSSKHIPSAVNNVPSVAEAFDDDDDFSDFHSSFPNQPPVSSSFHDTSFASAASDRQSFIQPQPQPQGALSIFPRISTVLKTTASHKPQLLDDFDDFSSFVSSPIRSPSPPKPPNKSVSLFDPPPTFFPITKPTLAPLLKPPPKSPSSPSRSPTATTPTSSLAHRRMGSHAAEHLHTLNLVERAAARPGRWPAPLSPSPEAIPPPPPPASFSAMSRDLLGDDMDLFGGLNVGGQLGTSPPPPPSMPVMGQMEKTAPLMPTPAPAPPLPPSLAPAPLLRPPGSGPVSFFPPTPAPAAVFVPHLPPPPVPVSTTTGTTAAAAPTQREPRWSPESTPLAFLMSASPPKSSAIASQPKGAGGLSAQDLSFFEGL